MRIYKVLPDLSKKKHMRMWHTALRSQWSAVDLDWRKPHRIQSRRFKDQLGRMLTPVLMGEQAALYSVSNLIQVLGKRSEVESQLYLTTWAVDEGRHMEIFTYYYDRIEREPMPIRRFPSGYLFQSYIISDDPAEWLAGVLVSECFAKHVMLEFRRLDLDPILSEIADGILVDEARHLGFNRVYVEDKFAEMFRAEAEGADAETSHLRARLEKVLAAMEPVIQALHMELTEVGFHPDELFHDAGQEARERLEQAVASGKRMAAKSEKKC